MLLNGNIESVSGDLVAVRLVDMPDMLRLHQLANGKQPSVAVEVEDGRSISPDQRKKIWALIGDYALYTGYSPLEMEAWTKAFYMAETGSEYFSMSNCSMSKASEYLSYVITFGFDHGLPWSTKHMDSIPDDYPLMMQCLKHRVCVICGKPADIDHEPPIGSGNDRDHIDNRKYKFMPLCRVHHTIRHQKGIDWFMDFYKIKPVKLDEETLVSLRLNTRKQFEEFDGRNQQ
ncbi:putative HNHc nuclease [Lacticaseibacillus mingshuiensis]|uniref:HNHc nuclease n=1 Tax=Lacticaseibacillus mingshuiensis TaxID=2799574 RepID=A0ABW4CG20_9LACO|nr:putative HNHc nuclease [Lacticaseibacillus mingshuiensis]